MVVFSVTCSDGKIQWVTAILIGSIVGGVILGLIQKKRVTDKDKKMDNKAANRTVIEKEEQETYHDNHS